MAAGDDFQDKALEGFTMFALNQGEVCTCPSRSLIQADIYDEFLELAAIRTKAMRQGVPLDTETMIGAQAPTISSRRSCSTSRSGNSEGAKLITGRRARGTRRRPRTAETTSRQRSSPATTRCGSSRRRSSGRSSLSRSFTDYDDAIKIANDTLYGLGAGVWSRDGNAAYRAGRDIKASRVWTNCYHQYPAHAAFDDYKQSGIGRENHKMMLDHYQQTKNLVVSYSQLGARVLLTSDERRA